MMLKYSKTVFAYWVYILLHIFLSSADFFQNKLKENYLGNTQTVWIQIRPDGYFVAPELGPIADWLQKLSAGVI